MARKRKIMKYEGMYVIKLLPADVKDLNLKEGDLADIEEAVFKSKKLNQNKR